MREFATSDHHFWHSNILKPTYSNRPWGTVEEMNEALIANWNATVERDDWVWVLGDFAFGGPKRAEEIARRLNGRLALVTGNHDWRTSTNRWLKMGFRMVVPDAEIRLAGRTVKLSHFPYAGDRGGVDRFVDARLKDEGDWLLHGHVHQHWKIRGRQINVGVDVWNYRPVALETLAEIIIGGAHA